MKNPVGISHSSLRLRAKKIPCVVGATQGEIFDEMVRWILSPHLTSKFFFSYLPR